MFRCFTCTTPEGATACDWIRYNTCTNPDPVPVLRRVFVRPRFVTIECTEGGQGKENEPVVDSEEITIGYIQQNGSYIYVADGLWPTGAGKETKEAQFGLLADDLKGFAKRGQATSIVQFYELVVPGLVMARHIFKGLERPLYCDNRDDGDSDKLVYTWRPRYDYEYIVGANARSVRRDPPVGKVFSVIVSTSHHTDEYPDIAGWIERWNWIDEDRSLSEAPKNWLDRYAHKVCTREA